MVTSQQQGPQNIARAEFQITTSLQIKAHPELAPLQLLNAFAVSIAPEKE